MVSNSAMSTQVDPSKQEVPEESGKEFFESPANFMCSHSQTTDVRKVFEIVSAQVQSLRATDTSWRAHLEIAGGNLDKVQFVRGANYFRQLSDIVRGQEGQIEKLQGKND